MDKDFPLHKVNFKFKHYIFTGTIGKPGVTKFAMKQSAPVPCVASECRQIFRCIQ